MKATASSIFILILALSVSGCSVSNTPNESDNPSPTAQTEPSPSPEDNNIEDTYSDEVNNPENRYPTEDSRFLEIFDEVGKGNNDSRFNRLAELLDSDFLTLEEVDQIYLLVEQGSNEELAYQLYLYELYIYDTN
jgi:hypothetical protein